MNKLRCLVVDDEELAREGLRVMLSIDTRFELIGTYAEGLSAIEAIESSRPDLVFLDVQMPGINGLEVIATLSKPRPYIIFTTAYEQFAIKAFEVSAVDYLLKPFTDDRFRKALDRAYDTYIRDRQHQVQPKSAVELQNNQVSAMRSIVVKSDGRVYQLGQDSILFVEAYDYYIKVHTYDRFHLVRESMKGIMDSLDPAIFVRAHNSFILNINEVKQVEKEGEGYAVLMTNGAEVKVSRKYRKVFKERLQN